MAVVAISDSILTDIADAIRSKNGTENTYKPSQMPDAIEAISGGITPTGTKQISITENGTTTEDVTNYANAEITVNVSGGDGGLTNLQLLEFAFIDVDFTGYFIGEFNLASDVSSGNIEVANPANALPSRIYVIKKNWIANFKAQASDIIGGYNFGRSQADSDLTNRTIKWKRDSSSESDIFPTGYLQRSNYNLISSGTPLPTNTTIYLRTGNIVGSTKWPAGDYIIAVLPEA